MRKRDIFLCQDWQRFGYFVKTSAHKSLEIKGIIAIK